MRLLASTTQRIAAAVALAAAGVLLPAAALAAPALAGWPAASPAAAAVPACQGGFHQVWLGLGQGAAGMNHTFVPIEFSNVSKQECKLTGAPTIIVVGRHGQIGKAADASPSQRSVIVPAGGTAHVVLLIVNPWLYAPHCHQATGQLQITLGGMSTDLTGYPVAQCRNRHYNLLAVDAIHSGVGVPAFTLR
jgi:Protein of unknown function (DUF4232)